jgi:hypothetical protein
MIRRLTLSLIFAVAASLTIGCGSGGGAVKVAGDVSFRGQPVDQGEIIFTTTDGQQSIATPIQNGKYELQVPTGAHQVRITAYRPVPGKVDRSNPGQETPVVEMYIPDQYNARTTLEARVDSPTNELHFPLGQG